MRRVYKFFLEWIVPILVLLLIPAYFYIGRPMRALLNAPTFDKGVLESANFSGFDPIDTTDSAVVTLLTVQGSMDSTVLAMRPHIESVFTTVAKNVHYTGKCFYFPLYASNVSATHMVLNVFGTSAKNSIELGNTSCGALSQPYNTGSPDILLRDVVFVSVNPYTIVATTETLLCKGTSCPISPYAPFVVLMVRTTRPDTTTLQTWLVLSVITHELQHVGNNEALVCGRFYQGLSLTIRERCPRFISQAVLYHLAGGTADTFMSEWNAWEDRPYDVPPDVDKVALEQLFALVDEIVADIP